MIAHLAVALTLQQGDLNQRLIQALEQFIPQIVRQEGTPGLNVALARGGKLIWEAGFGYADLERKLPMTAKTVTHSGSMGKTYTATAVMQLVERGVMGLDEPINTYLTEFQVTNPLGARDITVRDLLTHRSGLAGNTAGSEFAAPKPLGQHLKEDYPKPHFEWYGGHLVPRWANKVGEKYAYSNFGIATLGYLVEVTNPEKLSFSDYVQKHIIDPLGMTSTQYPPVQDQAHIRPEIWKNMSTGYAKLGPLRIPTPAVYFADFPAGAVVTTPGDHIRILLAYMNHGSYNGYQLLKPETVDTMLAVQVRTDSSHALGLGSRPSGSATRARTCSAGPTSMRPIPARTSPSRCSPTSGRSGPAAIPSRRRSRTSSRSGSTGRPRRRAWRDRSGRGPGRCPTSPASS
jgi:CubicO group peptidase (beta-lactamase class C family)